MRYSDAELLQTWIATVHCEASLILYIEFLHFFAFLLTCGWTTYKVVNHVSFQKELHKEEKLTCERESTVKV